ncbi:helix-turn-helix transcriptional regulator [Curtobacterium sp. Csp2]|uniref:helix-turn-helix domain-containing protein n=1 Tax=Curtobacterium sp. Csp2 TaxID=2495430 RepID=UPI0015801B84|nr:helix-turn-helix transcriptional regulator [Curtobacterium sp. Csp2]QKS15611.1 helix-turn-helix transcriptional regulator [Curtobacterium sp. Csp2]
MTMQELASGDLVPEWTVQDRMRKAREIRGLTQMEFADETGLSRATIRRVESGEKVAGRKEFNLWRMATGVSREWLETGVAPTPRPNNPQGGAKNVQLHSSA